MTFQFPLKTLTVVAISAAVFTLSCSKVKNSEVNETYLPDTIPAITGTEQTDAILYLGRALFYDKALSRANSVSCASCHKQENAFAENTAFSTGFEGRKTTRNSIAIQNINDKFSFGSKPLFWDGRESNITSLISKPIENHIEMGMDDPNALMAKVNSRSYVAPLAQKVFGKSEINLDEMAMAMSSFIGQINSNNCEFDREVVFSQVGTLSPLAKQGFALFNTTYQCNNCHQPTSSGFYNENSFANIGLDAENTDIGFMRVTKKETDRGRFKVPDLHNVMLTAPYMHDGRFNTIDEVLDHYSHGVQKSSTLDSRLKSSDGEPIQLNIKPEDREALKAFLASLTDYSMISDPNLSNPFRTK